MNFVLKHKKTMAFFAGAVGVAAFAPYYQIWSIFFSFSLLLYFLILAEGRRQAFAIGYSFGFAHFAVGLSWVGNALLIEPDRFGWLIPIALAAAGGFFGLFIALPAMLTWFSQKAWQKWLTLCSGLVVFEWVRSFLFTGFPWNLFGYTLAFNDYLIQAASVGGVYLLSLITLLCYSVFGIWLVRRDVKTALFCSAFVLMMSVGLYGFGYGRLAQSELKETDVVVRLVQPSIPQQMKWDRDVLEHNFQTYIDLSAVGEQNPQLIVWGETASPFMLDIDETHRQDVLPIIPENGYLITGMISYQIENGVRRPYNSMAVFDAAGNVAAYYHKSHLVPFGEYIPLREYLPSFIRPVANAIGTFGQGKGPEKIKLDGVPSFGGIICYEVIFPHEIVNQSQRPDFLINLTNDGWYGQSAGPYQHWATAKLRAVEEGIAIVRSANNGISGLITAYGQDKAVLPLNYTGVVDVKLDLPLSNTTVYSRFGNSVSLTFCLLLLFLGGIKIKKQVF